MPQESRSALRVRVGPRERTIDIVDGISDEGGRAPTEGPADSIGRTGLAPVHERVLELRDAGFSDEAIAAISGVALEAVPAAIEVAARKRGNQPNAGENADEVRAESDAQSSRTDNFQTRETKR